MPKPQSTKEAPIVAQPKGRLIDKVIFENATLAIHGGEEAQQAFNRALGSDSSDFVNYAMVQLTHLMAANGKTDLTIDMNAAVTMISGIAPTDALEAMLAAQMVATHHLTMELLARTARAGILGTLESNGNLATKFSRTFVAQMEALSRLRRGGEQVVKHVYVGEGGQAVFAKEIHHGRGVNCETNGQPHGPASQCPSLSGPDPTRDGMPIPVDAERAVPVARRAIDGGSDGSSPRVEAWPTI